MLTKEDILEWLTDQLFGAMRLGDLEIDNIVVSGDQVDVYSEDGDDKVRILIQENSGETSELMAG